MDAITGLLEGPRARGAFLLRSMMEPPWSLRIEDEAPLTIVAVVAGAVWVIPDDGEPARLDAGAVTVIRGPEPYTVSDDPGTRVQAVIHPGQRCTAPDGGPSTTYGPLGVRSWGNDPNGSTVLLTGTYPMPGEVGRPLLAALPDVLALADDSWSATLVALLHEEMARDASGQDAVLDRLLDLLVIATLRAWFSRPDAHAPQRYHALADRSIGPALRMLEAAPAYGWTVADLANRSGMSRAAFARRFHDLVGQPPMAFLTDLRIALAADMLNDRTLTLESVARQVGYGGAFAFSAAFKRRRGLSPTAHRRRGVNDRQGAAASR